MQSGLWSRRLIPQSVQKGFGWSQPGRGSVGILLFQLQNNLAGRTPDGLRISITYGQRFEGAFVCGEELQHKPAGLGVGDQNAGQISDFGTVEESAIHADDDAKILNARVACFY